MFENTISFMPLVRKRKQMFSELYASLILHTQISSYLDMLDEIGDPLLLLSDGEICLNTVNRCIQAIDNNYSHMSISYLLDSISESIIDSFTGERFDFFKDQAKEQSDEIPKFTSHCSHK